MASKTSSLGSISARLAGFRLIPRLETYPRVVAFAQTAPGKVIMLALFGLGLLLSFFDLRTVLLLIFALALVTFLPSYRRLILAVAPIGLVVMKSFWQPLFLGLNLAVIALGFLLYWCAMRWPKSLFGRRPIAFLLSGFSLLILLASAAAPHSMLYSILWNLVSIAVNYVWFIGYALIDRNSKPARDLTLELTAFHPIWGSAYTPLPKGAAYLRRIEAQNPEQLAITQLKGLKLLAWAVLLSGFGYLFTGFFYGYLRIPEATQALAMSVQGTPLALHLRWESTAIHFLSVLLFLTIWGGRIIALCRMAGFNALRNTYRPLYSTTIAEFFNRYAYYYKELLVDFFFFPVFFHYWKGHRRLRTVFATFAAACLGSVFFHFTLDWQVIQNEGLWKAIVDFQGYFFCCALLATGVSISQLRNHEPGHGFVRGRLIPAVGVSLFYCLIAIFTSPAPYYPLAEYVRFIAGLFFIHF
jgi:hypothetical protein